MYRQSINLRSYDFHSEQHPYAHVLLVLTFRRTKANIAVLTGMRGHELGWLCLGTCGADVSAQCFDISHHSIRSPTRSSSTRMSCTGRLDPRNGNAKPRPSHPESYPRTLMPSPRCIRLVLRWQEHPLTAACLRNITRSIRLLDLPLFRGSPRRWCTSVPARQI